MSLSVYWKSLYKKEIIVSDKKYLFIIEDVRKYLENILPNNFINYQNEYVNLDLVMLNEVLKNSIDSFVDINFFRWLLQTNVIKLNIYKNNNYLIFIVKDNWMWIKSSWTEDKKWNNKYLWQDWEWEMFIKNCKRVKKYMRVSKKKWSVIMVKIDISELEI